MPVADRKPLFECGTRQYRPMDDAEEEVGASEILFLQEWDELPPRDVMQARFLEAFGKAVFVEDDLLEVDLMVRVGEVDVATLYVFLNEDGLEMNGRGSDGYDIVVDQDIRQYLLAPANVTRDERMEALIRARPDDPAPYLAYADWLQSKGSRLGELIVVQYSLSHLGDAEEVKSHWAGLVQSFALPEADLATWGWRWGLFRWIRLENTRDWMDSSIDMMAPARQLFSSPMCAALEELRFGVLHWDKNYQDVPAVIAEAGRHAWAGSLKRLHLGDTEDVDTAMHSVGEVGRVISQAFPRLEWLKIHSGAQTWEPGETFGLEGFVLPELRELVIHTCAMTRARLESLYAAELPRLERLELWFGATAHDSDVVIGDVHRIIDGEVFGTVKHLGLCNAEFSDEIARRIVTSPLASRLETLDLSRGILTNAGAAALIDHASALPQLKTLNVDDNYLDEDVVGQLRSAFKCEVISESQKEDEDDVDRYVSVHE